MTGCISHRQLQRSITSVPDPCVLTPDSNNNIRMNFTFHVPGNFVTSRSRLVLTPQLVVGGIPRADYAPVVADAVIYRKKNVRKESVGRYSDPYAEVREKIDDVSEDFFLQYDETVALPDSVTGGIIRAVVSTDGCGECTGVDTFDIAYISNPATLIDVENALELSWMEPEFKIRPKIREGNGEARLQFIINRHDINLTLGNNRSEMQKMTDVLRPVLNDTLAEVNRLSIYGMASADGPYAFNDVLARNRAASASRWLSRKLNISPQVRKVMEIGSRPEGWWPVFHAMAADGHPDSVKVKNILTKYTKGNDDVQERYIRRLTCWRDIREKYLQKDRKVEYAYSYTIRSFTTDSELLYMYAKRPDAFNEDELLRVASLMETDSAKTEVYNVIMKYFPQSQVAANNLALLYMRGERMDLAKRTLERLEEFSPETLNTMAAGYVYANDYERAVELLQNLELPEARYNLGILKAAQRKLDEAYQLLKEYNDVNVAIVALALSLNSEAETIMQKVDDEDSLTEYVRAMIAARKGDTEAALKHLKNGCMDVNLRKRALEEPEFIRYHNDKRFMEITD